MKRVHLILIGLLICAGGYGQKLEKFKKDEKYGFRVKSGKVVVPAKYDNAGDFSEGLAAVKLKEKWGYVSETGKVVIKYKYDEARIFSEELAAVDIEGKWGYINKAGKVIIPLKYDIAGDFSEGLASVKNNDKLGFIDKTGKEIIPVKYDRIDNFSEEGLAKVKSNGKLGFIDKTGKEIVPVKYDTIDKFSEEGLAKVKSNGKLGFIDKTGKEIVPAKYDDVSRSMLRSLLKVKLEEKWGLIDTTGKEIVHPKYDKIDQCFEYQYRIAEVWIGNKCGLIDIMGKELLPVQYDWISLQRSYGKQREVWKDGKYGYLDDDLRVISPLKYKNQKIEMIWENILMHNIDYINDYYFKHGKSPQKSGIFSSGIFNINKPYLIITIKSEVRKEVSAFHYSGGNDNFNEQSFAGLKTLIVRYEFVCYGRQYVSSYDGREYWLNSLATILVYFDLDKKECIGFDIKCPELPYSHNISSSTLSISDYEIFPMINSRLKTSK